MHLSCCPCPSVAIRAAGADDVLRVLADVVDEAVLQGLLGREPAVALGVGLDLLDELLPRLMSGRITVKDAEKRVQEEV